MDPSHSPPGSKRRRSRSPEERQYAHDGGGRSSSRNRSPGYYAHSHSRRDHDGRGDRDQSRGDRSRNGDRSGNGYGRENGHAGRERDNGYGDRSRRRGETSGYGEKEREKEREGDRKRYEGMVKQERGDDPDGPPAVEPEKPNFGLSGLLAKETNTVKGVELKYNEPPEARKPLKNWRLYVFKGEEQIDLIHIYRQSAYLIGRDTVVTDIPIAHPSCSKQHAAIQYRQITDKNEYGEMTTSIKPFIIDLDSTNGTHVNDQEIPKSRYYELRNSDVIKFGTSSREYVLLHEDASA